MESPVMTDFTGYPAQEGQNAASGGAWSTTEQHPGASRCEQIVRAGRLLCVRPTHLEPVTHDENMRRQRGAARAGRWSGIGAFSSRPPPGTDRDA